jgi:hypothetical protein
MGGILPFVADSIRDTVGNLSVVWVAMAEVRWCTVVPILAFQCRLSARQRRLEQWLGHILNGPVTVSEDESLYA